MTIYFSTWGWILLIFIGCFEMFYFFCNDYRMYVHFFDSQKNGVAVLDFVSRSCILQI